MEILQWVTPCQATSLTMTGTAGPDLNINSLAPGKFKWNFRYVIFKLILVIDGWGISCEIVLIWMSLDYTDDQSTLVQVMAWCHQATRHYLSQCWPRSLLPYGVTRPQWVKAFYQSTEIPIIMVRWLWNSLTINTWLLAGIFMYGTE